MGVLEGRERPWRRREDSFADVLNAVKPLLTRFCVAKSVTYPPNLPNPPRTSPQTPALYTVKRCFALYGGGCLWGSSFSFLGGIYALKSAAFAPDLRAGCVGREYAFRKCKFIPPHIEKIFQPNRNNTWVVPPKSTTNFLPFLSGSGSEARQQVAAVPIPLDGIGRESSRNSQHGIWLRQNQHKQKARSKNPLA